MRNRLRSFVAILSLLLVAVSLSLAFALSKGVDARAADLADMFEVSKQIYSEEGPLSYASYQRLEGDEKASNLGFEFIRPAVARQGEGSYPIDLAAVGTNFLDIYGYELESGETIIDYSKRSAAVLGSSIATEMFGSSSAALGRTFKIGDEDVLILGVLKEYIPASFDRQSSMNGQVFVSSNAYGRIVGSDLISVDRIFLDYSGSNDVPKAVAADSGFTDVKMSNINEKVDEKSADIISFIYFAAPFALLLASISVANVMVAVVSSRTREIGVRKSVGASSGDIFIQHVVEPLQLGFVAAFMTFVVSLFAAAVSNKYYDLPLEVDLLSFIFVSAFVLFLPAIFGIYPAYIASRKDVNSALRQE